ncbi:hypothetical protein [Nocardia otitidiscaviarum]|uniref:hypothetical protein n=1 Tax=Nocardia otitidiscaviarum TaxID=1823 RepID=UPI001C3F3B2E|nr:hypothetical protein [Nocardia otitidiscaviarum]
MLGFRRMGGFPGRVFRQVRWLVSDAAVERELRAPTRPLDLAAEIAVYGTDTPVARHGSHRVAAGFDRHRLEVAHP